MNVILAKKYYKTSQKLYTQNIRLDIFPVLQNEVQYFVTKI